MIEYALSGMLHIIFDKSKIFNNFAPDYKLFK
jgi:hypothetical protein